MSIVDEREQEVPGGTAVIPPLAGGEPARAEEPPQAPQPQPAVETAEAAPQEQAPEVEAQEAPAGVEAEAEVKADPKEAKRPEWIDRFIAWVQEQPDSVFVNPPSVLDMLKYAREAQITTEPNGPLRKGAIAWSYVAVALVAPGEVWKRLVAKPLSAALTLLFLLTVSPFLNAVPFVGAFVPNIFDVTWIWTQLFG